MPARRSGPARLACAIALGTLALVPSALLAPLANAARPDEVPAGEQAAQRPQATPRPVKAIPTPGPAPAASPKAAPPANPASATAQPERLKRLAQLRSWGYQLVGLNITTAAKSPFDLLVVDATGGLDARRPMTRAEIQHLQQKPDGSRRLVIGYLSIGEAEDYRADYFAPEYLSEDAPEWLGPENRQWKGNRIVHFCHEGWQRTILGDEQGRNLYNAIEPSPLYRLLELGLDGVYLDRVDVYAEVGKDCRDGERKMVDFVARIGAHARKANPQFLVVLQNAEELVRHPRLLDTIDAIAKEDLFYGADHGQELNGPKAINGALEHLKAAKAAGRPVLVVDYLTATEKKADARKRIEQQGFIPYIGPRDLGRLWLPGKDF